MNKCSVMALAVCFSGVVHAQESDLSVSVGLKAWNTQWTTFSYGDDGSITQEPAKDKVILVPQLVVRYRDFMGSISGYRPTRYQFIGGPGDTRKEFDANLGYFVAPGVVVTLGYKKLAQVGSQTYKLSGPVVGVSAAAPLGGAFALYGSFGYGWLKTPAKKNINAVEFDADYQLGEVGLAYSLATGSVAKTLTFTMGYRSQVFSSKDAAPGQDGRDLTHGLTLGVVAKF
jgi:hypothetical protein